MASGGIGIGVGERVLAHVHTPRHVVHLFDSGAKAVVSEASPVPFISNDSTISRNAAEAFYTSLVEADYADSVGAKRSRFPNSAPGSLPVGQGHNSSLHSRTIRDTFCQHRCSASPATIANIPCGGGSPAPLRSRTSPTSAVVGEVHSVRIAPNARGCPRRSRADALTATQSVRRTIHSGGTAATMECCLPLYVADHLYVHYEAYGAVHAIRRPLD